MEKINQLFQCTICMTPYDNIRHVPYVLHCGHSICNESRERLFEEGHINCPLCKAISNYESIAGVPKNFTLIQMIDTFQNEAFINTPIPFREALEPVEALIEKVKTENQKIKNYFDQIIAYKDSVLQFNEDLIQMLEVYLIISDKKQSVSLIS